MSVRRINPGEEAILRNLRLQALADAPYEFDSTLDRESAFAIADWRRWLTDGATFVFEQSGEAKGIAAGIAPRDKKSAVYLVSMWVRPEARGTGAGDDLVAAVLSWAKSEGAAEVLLDVTMRNDRARRFYERNGFCLTGRELTRERDGVLEVEMSFALARGTVS